MACDTQFLAGQTVTERKAEVQAAVSRLDKLLAAGKVKPIIGKQGAIAFDGWLSAERGRVSDACAYRRIMATGSAFAKLAIGKAEAAAGRTVNRLAVAQGNHSHDGGKTWHSGH